MKPTPIQPRTGLIAAAAAVLAAPALVDAQERTVPDTYKAVTVNMTPADVELKADVIRWSAEDERAAVIAVLAEAENAESAAEALGGLPTLGVVWRSGSPVGHSIKYAHRTTSPDGSERITLVTDKRIGSTSFEPWTAGDGSTEAPLAYSVVEMVTGENAEGTLSLGAEVVIDTASGTISLDRGARAPLLTNVTREPKPYWAN